MTETILHGYQIIVLPRANQPVEVVVTNPYHQDQRYTGSKARQRIGQLEKELQVMRLAEAMRAGDEAEVERLLKEAQPA